MCVREDFSRQLAEWLVTDIENTVKAWEASRKQQEEKVREGQREASEKLRIAREEALEEKEVEKKEGEEREGEEEKGGKAERPEMKEEEEERRVERRVMQRMVEGAMFPPAAAVAASSGAAWGVEGKGERGAREGEAVQRAKEHPIC